MKRRNTFFNLCLMLAALLLFFGIRAAHAIAIDTNTNTNTSVANGTLHTSVSEGKQPPGITQKTETAAEVFKKENGFTYTVIHQIIVENKTANTARNIQISVPAFSTQQPIYQEIREVEYNPQPESFLSGEDGNETAVYNIERLAPGERQILEQRFIIDNYKGSYQINAAAVSDDYQGYAGIDPRYLQPEPGIESDHKEIIQYAKETVGNETNPYLIARKLFADINLYLNYRDGEYANQGALSALRTGEGVCQEYANLFVASLRALGIPARVQVGYLYNSTQHTGEPYVLESGYLNGDLLSHSWAEFYLPDIGWVIADPTFTYTLKNGDKEVKLVDWSYFGRIASERSYLFWTGQNPRETTGSYSYTDAPVSVEFHAVVALGDRYSPFTDIGHHWARESILSLSQDRILTGKRPGYFGVNDLVTRDELAAVIVRTLAITNQDRPNVETTFNYTDINTGYWAFNDIFQASLKGFLYGYPDGTFGIGKPVTRAEMAAILVRLFNLTDNSAAPSAFTDLDTPGQQWAKQDIVLLEHKNFVAGRGNGQFAPGEYVTRGEMAAFISKALYNGK
ncbi:MAG: hypothetical protein HFI72_00180 [Peptococcaceae bacterium]|nr:hypothetical protein [Peptococcaceae bacterium]